MSHRVIACIVMDPVSVLQVQVAVVNRRDWSKASTSSALFRGGGGRSGSSSIPSRVPIHNRGDITVCDGLHAIAFKCAGRQPTGLPLSDIKKDKNVLTDHDV